MNKYFLLKNSYDEEFYCILDSETDFEKQFEKVFAVRQGYGFSVRYSDTEVKLWDYFSGEARASFEILSIEDTDKPLLYHLTKL